MDAEDAVNTVLDYIGFSDGEIPRVATELEVEDGLKAFAIFDSKRTKELATDLKERSVAAQRVVVGSLRASRIRAVAHWVNDKLRIDEEPTVEEIEEDEFQTLKSTTQRFVPSALMPASRRYRNDRIYSLPQLRGEWFKAKGGW